MNIISTISTFHNAHINPTLEAFETVCESGTLTALQYIQTNILKPQKPLSDEQLKPYARLVHQVIDTIAVAVILSSNALSVVCLLSAAFLGTKHIRLFSLDQEQKSHYIQLKVLPVLSHYITFLAISHTLIGMLSFRPLHILQGIGFYGTAQCFDHLTHNATAAQQPA